MFDGVNSLDSWDVIIEETTGLKGVHKEKKGQRQINLDYFVNISSTPFTCKVRSSSWMFDLRVLFWKKKKEIFQCSSSYPLINQKPTVIL